MSTPNDNQALGSLAAALAWVWPGLGHITLGEKKRGLLIMAGVLLMVITGLLVGGIDSVDRRNDRLWFLAQVICGPITIGIDWANQNYVQVLPDDFSSDYQAGDPATITALNRIGIARANEMGTLFIALAGLMNLIVMLDCLRERRPMPAGSTEVQPAPQRRSDDA